MTKHLTLHVARLALGLLSLGGCAKSASSPTAQVPQGLAPVPASAAPDMSGCDHSVKSYGAAQHAWPYPAEARNVRWGDRYQKMPLKLKPTNAAFVTATLTWKPGELIEVQDSKIIVGKPRMVTTTEDLLVYRKVWDQGIEVVKTIEIAAAGEQVGFMFYNSRGNCMIATEDGPVWTECTLGVTFEEVTEEEPFACEQTWWIQVGKSRVDKGWMPFEDTLMTRVPASPNAAAK